MANKYFNVIPRPGVQPRGGAGFIPAARPNVTPRVQPRASGITTRSSVQSTPPHMLGAAHPLSPAAAHHNSMVAQAARVPRLASLSSAYAKTARGGKASRK